MNNSNKEYFEPTFSHVYIEREALQLPMTRRILRKLPHAEQIVIRHYKDVFCRNRQSFGLQKKSQKLILAMQNNACIYEGAKPCQSFGHTHFYYTAGVMNCLYDCEYCYLQGLYPSANLVVFVNTEEIFRQAEQLLERHPLYLCISYDTDLLALEPLLGQVRQWIAFAEMHENLTIEIRTKSAAYRTIADLTPPRNVILAWTLSPERVAEQYEHGAASLDARLENIAAAAADGWNVRLCFDPMVWQNDWRELYRTLVDTTFHKVSPADILDCSIGQFRVAKDALKKMRKNRADSAIVQYPYQLKDGFYQYDAARAENMAEQMRKWTEAYLPTEKIF